MANDPFANLPSMSASLSSQNLLNPQPMGASTPGMATTKGPMGMGMAGNPSPMGMGAAGKPASGAGNLLGG